MKFKTELANTNTIADQIITASHVHHKHKTIQPNANILKSLNQSISFYQKAISNARSAIQYNLLSIYKANLACI